MCIFLGKGFITFTRFSGEFMTQKKIRIILATLYKFRRKKKGRREEKKDELEQRPCF